jgi:hypothetical protein
MRAKEGALLLSLLPLTAATLSAEFPLQISVFWPKSFFFWWHRPTAIDAAIDEWPAADHIRLTASKNRS